MLLDTFLCASVHSTILAVAFSRKELQQKTRTGDPAGMSLALFGPAFATAGSADPRMRGAFKRKTRKVKKYRTGRKWQGPGQQA